MHVSVIMIKALPLRKLVTLWWIVAWGCTPSKASALRDFQMGQRTCCAEMRIFISCDSVMKTFNKTFVCINVCHTMCSVWGTTSDKIRPSKQAVFFFKFVYFWSFYLGVAFWHKYLNGVQTDHHRSNAVCKLSSSHHIKHLRKQSAEEENAHKKMSTLPNYTHVCA